MKALSVARKTLVELWREPMLLGLLFFFPVMMIWLYDIAFGQTDQGLSRYMKLLVINQDQPAEGQRLGGQFIETLQTIEFENQPVFNISLPTSQNFAQIALREHKAALLVIIPPNFTLTLLNAAQGFPPDTPATITLIGDPASDNYAFARSLLEGLIDEFSKQAAGLKPSITIIYEYIPGTGTTSDFDFGMPGMIVFGIMFLVVSTAMIMVRENVAGTLKRLRLTSLSAGELLLGVTQGQMFLAIIMVPLVLGTAVAFGFQSRGSLLLAIGVGLLLSLAAVGLGLVTACFAHNDSEAANLGASLGVLMVLISPALYQTPYAPLFTIAGHTVQIYDFLPTTHAAEALRRVLLLGDGFAQITYQMAWLGALSILTLGIGVGLYGKLQMKKEK